MFPEEIELGSASFPKSLEASKWLKAPLLLSANELNSLFSRLGLFWLFKAGGLIKEGESCDMTGDEFIDVYKKALLALKEGDNLKAMQYKPFFSAFLTREKEAIFRIPVVEKSHILKVKKPIIQLQMHTLSYSQEDGQFRSMVFGETAFFFGILFSYPQLMKDQATESIIKIDQSENFQNSQVFKNLLGWQRQNTMPTPFIVDGKRVNVPARIGKECFSWINEHPSLKKLKLQVLLPEKIVREMP